MKFIQRVIQFIQRMLPTTQKAKVDTPPDTGLIKNELGQMQGIVFKQEAGRVHRPAPPVVVPKRPRGLSSEDVAMLNAAEERQRKRGAKRLANATKAPQRKL